MLTEQVDFDYEVNGISIYPANKEPRKIIVHIAPLKFYNISIDGKDIRFVNEKDIPLIIDVPANTARISVKYIDYYFYSGLFIFTAYNLILLFYYLKNRYGARKD